MRVVWSDEAIAEIEAIISYVAIDNPTAAMAIANRIFDAVETVLSDNPNSGRPGRVVGTRELIVHQSYITAYRVHLDHVEVLTVRHTSRLWPENL